MLELEKTPVFVNVVKDNKNNSYIQKNNLLMLGFFSWNDLMEKLVGVKFSLINFIIAIFVGFSSFITHYIYNDAKAVFFMLGLVGLDAIFGIIRALKNKTFSSARLPRIIIVMLTYSGCLATGTALAKFSTLYSFIPGILISAFCTTSIVSIWENLHLLKLISDDVYNMLSKKLNALQILLFGGFNVLNKKNKKKK